MTRDLFGIGAARAPSTWAHARSGPDVSLQQWFTAPWMAELLVEDGLRGLGPVDVLEPSCGDGAMLGAVPAAHRAIGIEIDPRMAALARRNTGREVIEGDYATVDLNGRTFGAVVGNPPFGAEQIDALAARAHGLLPDDGVLALILPAHVAGSSERMARWRERFSIEIRMLPRALFPRLTLPLVWARMIRGTARTLVGVMLFDEHADVMTMPNETRRMLQGGATWRQTVSAALGSLGEEATLTEIYAAVEPRRPTENRHWRDKVRQTLGLYFERIDDTRWRIPA